MADYISTLTGVQMDAALIDMAEHNSEAYAVGERNGIPVGSDDVTYQNNAQYYAQQAQSIAPASVTEAVRWDIAQTALTDANKAQARANIDAGKNGAWSNRNLLDNWYFVGGGSQLGEGVFPINQRGQSSYTAAGNNGIDRWGGSYCNIVLNASGLTVTSTGYTNNIYQFVPYKLWDGLVGKTVTLSFDIEAISGSWAIAAHNTAVGTISATGITSVSFVVPSVADSNKFIGLAGQSGNVITIKAVKLEEGTVSTIANDAPPDFGGELRKCQRRLFIHDFASGEIIADGFAVSASYSVCSLVLPVSMASDGTLTGTVTANPLIYGGGTGEQVSSFSVSAVKGNYAKIGVATTVMPSNNAVALYANTNIRLTISKEL